MIKLKQTHFLHIKILQTLYKHIVLHFFVGQMQS